MAQFELNIYGENDEIVKRFETNKVRWGVFVQALELQESLDEQSAAQQFSAVNKFMKKIFPGMSDGDLENADGDDVMNTFKQLLRKAGKIAGSNNSKNSTGAE